jgi:hypothetical protein
MKPDKKKFFHSFNGYIGRESKTRGHILARDFLIVFVGFDYFGPLHKRYKLKKEIVDKIKEKEKGKFKIFEKDNYIYQVYDKKEINEKSTCIKILEKKKEAFSLVSKVLKIEKDNLLTSKLLKFNK